MTPIIAQIDLTNLDAAELALICKMPHVSISVRNEADKMMEALVGRKNARALRLEAWKAIDSVSATDAVLYIEREAAK